MNAVMIRMKQGCKYSQCVQEIAEIKLSGYPLDGWYSKESIYDYLIQNPRKITVAIYPYPYLIPVKSIYGEKYVRSEANDTVNDNLLKLPRA